MMWMMRISRVTYNEAQTLVQPQSLPAKKKKSGDLPWLGEKLLYLRGLLEAWGRPKLLHLQSLIDQ